MKNKTLTEAVKQAELFIKQAKVVQEEQRGVDHDFYGNKETGTLRRRSMDLTNSLADLRRHD